MKRENLLIVADSERDADMLYAVGMFVPDPFIFLRVRGQGQLVLSDLEVDRARKVASHCRVTAWSVYQRKLKRNGRLGVGMAQVIREVLREHRVKRVQVPRSFPLGLARELRRLEVKLKPRDGVFFPERQFKTAAEVKKISAALTMAEVGLAEGIQALHNSRVGRDGRLMYHNVPLTSEKLRAIIDTAVIQAGGIAAHTIVAGGRQACDPHEGGQGQLRANEPIILDVFPRSQKTGYYGDITRTVVRGRASEAVRRAHQVVLRGQELAFGRLRAGVRARTIHETVCRFFEKEGYATCRRAGRMEGYIHGTGHGVGLDLHEGPQLAGHSEETLRSGHVVTIEPGLYYRCFGGVRIEDVALVLADGARNLTKFEKVLEV